MICTAFAFLELVPLPAADSEIDCSYFVSLGRPIRCFGRGGPCGFHFLAFQTVIFDGYPGRWVRCSLSCLTFFRLIPHPCGCGFRCFSGSVSWAVVREVRSVGKTRLFYRPLCRALSEGTCGPFLRLSELRIWILRTVRIGLYY